MPQGQCNGGSDLKQKEWGRRRGPLPSIPRFPVPPLPLVAPAAAAVPIAPSMMGVHLRECQPPHTSSSRIVGGAGFISDLT